MVVVVVGRKSAQVASTTSQRLRHVTSTRRPSALRSKSPQLLTTTIMAPEWTKSLARLRVARNTAGAWLLDILSYNSLTFTQRLRLILLPTILRPQTPLPRRLFSHRRPLSPAHPLVHQPSLPIRKAKAERAPLRRSKPRALRHDRSPRHLRHPSHILRLPIPCPRPPSSSARIHPTVFATTHSRPVHAQALRHHAFGRVEGRSSS